MGRPAAALSGELESAGARSRPLAVAVWLLAIALLVFAMIVVGGATRLTDSGLSITEWQPILGAIPPLSDADWAAAFQKYRQTTEYREINRGMSLEAFQYIYWWEWAHRQLGRVIGLAYAVPLAVFWLLGALPRGYVGRLLAILALGGLQGLVGWYMVQSGLADRIDVSHYRLTLHLGLAFLILAAVLWTALDVLRVGRSGHLLFATRSQRAVALALLAVVFMQVLLGGLVAGSKAGLTYNTWPLMDGRLIPDGVLQLSPWYMNLVENITTMQFNHRLMAYLLVLAAALHWLGLWRSGSRAAGSGLALLLVVLAQAAIGIATLLAAEGRIPIGLGLAHQGGGAAVLAFAVWHARRMAGARTPA